MDEEMSIPIYMALQSLLGFLQEGVAGLSFTARIGRAQFYRARSASKKDSLAIPYLPSKLARYLSGMGAE